MLFSFSGVFANQYMQDSWLSLCYLMHSWLQVHRETFAVQFFFCHHISPATVRSLVFRLISSFQELGYCHALRARSQCSAALLLSVFLGCSCTQVVLCIKPHWVSLTTGLEYGMEQQNGKRNGTVNAHNYS